MFYRMQVSIVGCWRFISSAITLGSGWARTADAGIKILCDVTKTNLHQLPLLQNSLDRALNLSVNWITTFMGSWSFLIAYTRLWQSLTISVSSAGSAISIRSQMRSGHFPINFAYRLMPCTRTYGVRLSRFVLSSNICIFCKLYSNSAGGCLKTLKMQTIPYQLRNCSAQHYNYDKSVVL